MEDLERKYFLGDALLKFLFIGGKTKEFVIEHFRKEYNLGVLEGLAFERWIVEFSDMGYLELQYKEQILNITVKGRDLIRKGGLKKKAELDAGNKIKSEKKELEETELRQYNIRNARRIYKTYWITFCFAIVGGIVSVVLAILKVLGK